MTTSRFPVVAILMIMAGAATAQDTTNAVAKRHWLGKLHPDSLVNMNLSVVPVPVLSSSPETGVKFGVNLQYFLNTTRKKDSSLKARDSYAYVEALYSTRGQTEIGGYFQLFTPGEKFFIRNRLGYIRYNERIWGFGNNTLGNNDFEKVDYTRLYFQTSFTRQVKNQIFVGLNQNFSKTYKLHAEIKDTNFLAGQPGEQGGTVLGIGPTLIIDRRDHPLSARTGWYAELAATFYARAFGSDFNYTEYLADVRRFVPLRDNSVLAFQFYSMLTSGTVPWREQSRMGNGTIMRGYFAGRYRDNQYAAAQAEYRKPVHRWATLALFASAGQVQHRINGFNLSDTKLAGGAGVRVLANKAKRIYVRMDFAVSTDKTSGIYFKVGDAF